MRKREGRAQAAASRPVILDVLPAHLAPRLDVVPRWKRLARRLLYASRRTKILVSLGTLLTVSACMVLLFIRGAGFLLPSDFTSRIQGFTPYFYEHSIPDSYTFNKAHIVYDGRVLMIPLEKSGSPSIVLTEQLLPDGLSDEAVQQNGESVSVPDGKATVNNIEGRLVGTLLVRRNKVLILLNAPGEASQADLKALLQGLHPFVK